MGKRPEQILLKGDREMVNKYMKRCSMLLIIREIQVKTAMKYHLTLIRMAIIKKFTNNKFWRGYGEKGTLILCWWECKLIQTLWRIVWRFLKKPKLGITAIPLLGVYPQKTIIQKDTCTPMFNAALFTIVGTWKQPKCSSIEKWIKKVWYIYTMGYYLVIKE